MPAPVEVASREDVRDRIIEHAARLLTDGGAAAVTTRRVADAAGVQPPTIYRLFGDKNGLLDAVAEHVMARHVAAKAAAIDDDDPVEALREGWHRQVAFGVDNPDLVRLMNARENTSPAITAGIQILQRRIRRLAAAGVLAVSERRALELFHAAGAGAVQALVEVPAGERDPGLADAMFDAVLGATTRASAAPLDTYGIVPVANALAARIHDLPGLSEAERSLMREWLQRSIRSAQRA